MHITNFIIAIRKLEKCPDYGKGMIGEEMRWIKKKTKDQKKEEKDHGIGKTNITRQWILPPNI